MLKKFLMVILVIGVLMSGCAAQPAASTQAGEMATMTASPAKSVQDTPAKTVLDLPTATLTPSATPVVATATPERTPATGRVPSCDLAPIREPTMAPNPGYTELDESTGLHVTGGAVKVDLATYRLQVTGLVEAPLSLSLDDLRCMPKVTAKPALVCPGYFVDITTWSGVPIASILELAGASRAAKRIVMVSADGYETLVDIKTAQNPENFLAYEWEGQPLPILHGFPLRAVFPTLDGNKWAKWLVEIRVE